MRVSKEFGLIFLTTFIIYFGSFLVVYKTGLNTQILQSEDFISTAVVPFSIIKEGNLNLNEYYDLFLAYYPHPDNPFFVPYYLKNIGEKVYSAFPSLTSILVLPVYVLPAYYGYDSSIDGIRILSRLGGAFLTALSAAVFWFVLKQTQLSNKKRILLLIIYAFATNSFSTSSQGLWQHGSSQLLNAMGLLMLLKGFFGPAGFVFGLSTIARPTNLLSLVVFAVYTYYKTRDLKKLRAYILLGLIPLIWEFGLSTFLYGSIFNTGYGSQNHWTANIFEGFFGLLASPSKGLFITSPILIFSIYAFYKALKSPLKHLLNTFLAATVFIHTIVMGKWYNWFGGYSWGTRMLSDVLPYIVFLMIPFIESRYFNNKKVRIAFYVLLALSIIYHASGLIFFDGVWHTIYDGKDPYWLWSIINSEPIFSIKRALNQAGLIENPIPQELRAQ